MARGLADARVLVGLGAGIVGTIVHFWKRGIVRPSMKNRILRLAVLGVLLAAPLAARSQDAHLDLDRDGLPDIASTEDQSEAISVKVWLGAVGGPERPTPDIHVSCPKGCDAEVSSGVFLVPDIDLDGSLELGVLASQLMCPNGEPGQVYTVFMSGTGLPGIRYAGPSAFLLAMVLDARARGGSLDELLWAAFPAGASEGGSSGGSGSDSSDSGSSESSGSGGAQSGDSCSSGLPCDRLWDERVVMALALRDGDPTEWVNRILLFASLSKCALNRAEQEYPLDGGRKNALRHALWQFLLTCSFGAVTAKELGDIHEECAPDPCDSAIDQFNSQRARELIGVFPCPTLGSECSGLDALVEELQRRIEAGEFIIDPSDPRVSPPCAQGTP